MECFESIVMICTCCPCIKFIPLRTATDADIIDIVDLCVWFFQSRTRVSAQDQLLRQMVPCDRDLQGIVSW